MTEMTPIMSTNGTGPAGGTPADGAGAGARADVLPDIVIVDPDRRAPGRPRSARADEAIIEATLDLLAEGVSVEALSMESVAARAGVGKATIYRRWSSKEALVVDAVGALKGPVPELGGESVREDLLTLLRPMRTPASTRAGRIMPCLIPEMQRNAELHRRYQALVEPRRELMRVVLRRGIADGTLRADLDITATVIMLMSPLIVQTMLKWQPELDLTGFPEKIVDTLLPGMLAG
jgi:AcrR family transcriptional regulator